MLDAITHFAALSSRLAVCLLPVLFAASAPALGQGPTPDPDTAPVVSESVEAAPADPVLDALPVPRTVEQGVFTPLGSEDGLDKAHIEFTPFGAGIERLTLPDAYRSVAHKSHIELQSTRTINAIAAVPFAVTGVEIEGRVVDLTGVGRPGAIWDEIEPGVFRATVESASGQPLLGVTRRYRLKGGDLYGFTIANTLENLSDTPLTVRLIQTGPIDLPAAENNYAGDMRRVRFGTLPPTGSSSADLTVRADSQLARRADYLGKRTPTPNGAAYQPRYPLWPNTRDEFENRRLSWLGLTDRYFAVVLHPVFDPADIGPDSRTLGVGPVDRLVLDPRAEATDAIMLLRLNGETTTLAPGESTTSTLGVYAGPMRRPTIRLDPVLAALRVPEVVVYNLGGWCAPCTFSWLTDTLMSVLRLFHAISGDWAVAIMLLVVLVRSCLHPITRWSQIRMQRFGVQMQSMGPKQVKIKEKYKDDPKKLQQEMAKLWKEEGINPAGMLGCLPMFLQTPVWMALYATLFFAIELRQEPAFYGLFQAITNNHWQFLADLSQPDHAIPLPAAMHFSFPLWGTVTAVNILPLLLGVVFYVHQKYLTPPTTATMTPEQAQQQKIIKVMMVVMFPLMMYAAPSGLAIYFITNSALGIAEHKWIRAHMDRHGLLDLEKIRVEKKKKGPGFMARLSEAAETQRGLEAQAHGGRPPRPARRKKK